MKGIIDSTLREGEQTVGVSFTLEQKLQIIKRLDTIGIEEIEVGIASRYDETPKHLIEKSRKAGIFARLAIWSRCLKHDIEIGARARPDVLSISIPVSDLHIEKKLGKNREWILEKIERSIQYALSLEIPAVSLGLEDATRADLDFMVKAAIVAERNGIGRLRLADTVGISSPAEIKDLVEKMKGQVGVEIGVHMHNDFGMATANSITAIDAGANWADATVLGLGERAGNARLEELAAYLCLQRDRHYKIQEIPRLSSMISQTAGRKIPVNRPIVGRGIFTCETGLHLQGLQRDPTTYEPFPPQLVEAKRNCLYGRKIGRRQIIDLLNGIGNRQETL